MPFNNEMNINEENNNIINSDAIEIFNDFNTNETLNNIFN